MVGGKHIAAALLLLLSCDGMSLAQTEQRTALVIGNGNYLNFPKLVNPANGAATMAVMLRRAHFDVVERENITQRQMRMAVRTFVEKLSPGEVALFYYAGHGIQVQGSNYVLPVDVNLVAEDDIKYETYDVQDVLNKLSDARVHLSLIILDACRDNPFAKSFRSAPFGLAKIDPPRDTIIAYATAPGQVAADGDGYGKNGVYTRELLKFMSKSGRKLQDVLSDVANAVDVKT